MQAVGFEVDDEAGREATAVVDAANRLLEQLTPAVLQAFSCGLEAVAMPLVPFINNYVARLKMLARRCVGLGWSVVGVGWVGRLWVLFGLCCWDLVAWGCMELSPTSVAFST